MENILRKKCTEQAVIYTILIDILCCVFFIYLFGGIYNIPIIIGLLFLLLLLLIDYLIIDFLASKKLSKMSKWFVNDRLSNSGLVQVHPIKKINYPLSVQTLILCSSFYALACVNTQKVKKSDPDFFVTIYITIEHHLNKKTFIFDVIPSDQFLFNYILLEEV